MKQLQHILIFTKELHHPLISKSGGTGIFYKNLARELAERGIKVTVFGSNKKSVDFTEDGIRYKFVQDYFRKNKLTELIRSLSGKFKNLLPLHYSLYEKEKKYLTQELQLFIRKENLSPDIIETHDWEGMSLFLEELKIPYVVRYHGSWNVLAKYFGYERSLGKMHCEKQALPKSTYNIVISEYSKIVNSELYHVKNPKLIYNGIDTAFFSPSDSLQKIPFSIFILGDISEQKGAYTAALAFREVYKKFSKSTLHFIGHTGNHKEKLLQLTGKDASNHIVFLGRKPAREFIGLLEQAEIMFFPSKGENFSLSLLEAMALGKAIIVSAIPSFEEIVNDGENGMIAKDAAEFAEKAQLLFTQPQLRKDIGIKAAETVRENYNIEKMVNETITFYQKIVCRN